MVSSSNFTTSNISISRHKNSYFIRKKNSSFDTPHIMISHGSKGITSTELMLADFLLEKGLIVSIVDHFTPLGITELLWIPQTESTLLHTISLNDLIATVPKSEESIRFHLGLSLGGYIGLNAASHFNEVYACYPAPLPMSQQMILNNLNKIQLFYGTNDTWTRPPQQLLDLLEHHQVHAISGAHHSFMSDKKDKVFDVNKYTFFDYLVDNEVLAKIMLSHESLALWGTSEKVRVHNKSCEVSKMNVLNRILGQINE